MITIVYASRAARDPTHEELEALLAEARDRNAMVAVTGLLLYHAGSFLQQLEGDPAAVDATFERISRDPRHLAIRQLSRREIARPRFAGWAMGFARPDPDALAAQLPGYHGSLAAPLVDAEIVRDARVAETLLLLYSRA